jgi:16S rRNA (uracil1498-N3)-methyltransferase
MRLTRCFVPGPLQVGTLCDLPAAAAIHVARVLRLSAGDELTVFDGRGGEYAARLVSTGRQGARARIESHSALERESPLAVTLLQALARGERMDFIVQKATELGVSRVLAFASERSVLRLGSDARARRLEHWRAVAISACEQCGRNRIPSVTLASDLAAACAQAEAPLRVLLDPRASLSLPAALQRTASLRQLALLIGPEGGLSEAELQLALRSGFLDCRLGSRVLRAETAPLAALAVAQALAGDLRD